MSCTLYGVPILLAAGTTAQQYAQFNGQLGGAYPTGNGYYGQMTGYMGGYVGGGYAGGYGGQYGRQCRSNVRSEDLQGGFQQCFCDKNHRDEDPCSAGFEEFDTQARRLLGLDEPECQRSRYFNDYYDDIFDEDCVQRWQQIPNVRRCQSKTTSKDLAGTAVCACDSNHKKDFDDVEDAIDACLKDTACPDISFGEDDAVGFHYSIKPREFASVIGGDENCCDSRLEQDMEDEMEQYDPNCVQRFGGYGAYGQQFGGYGGFNMGYNAGYGQQFGGYGGFNMGYNAGYGQQFGGNMFYPTSFAQPAAAAPVDGAAPVATFQPQFQQFSPQYNFGGYRGYYGR